MYEENKRFDWMNFLIKAIIFVIVILFIVWLLSLSTKNMSKGVDVLKDNIIVENVDRMQDVGENYFTIDKLPKNIGETSTITLDEMYRNHLILGVTGKDGKTCNKENSYVSVTKTESGYEMKTYLECGEDSEYIVRELGCYDYCNNCNSEVNPEKPEEPIEGDKQIEYQYSKTTGGKWTSYGNWSDWSTKKVTPTNAKQTQTKVVTETYYELEDVTKTKTLAYTLSCPNGYELNNGRCQKLDTTTVTNTPSCASTLDGYTLVSQNGLTCNYKKVVSNTTTSNQYVKTATGSYLPGDTSEYHYEKVSVTDTPSCDTVCKMQTIYTYKVYKKVKTTSQKTYTKTSTLSCPSGYDNNNGSCVKTTSSYSYQNAIKVCKEGTLNSNGTNCIKTYTEKEYVEKTKSTTYYRYRVRSYINGTTTTKWSILKNDNNLLNAGYKLTGKTRTTVKELTK